jgi:hypothetical protein
MTMTISERLTPDERRELAICENHIQQAWFMMADALDRIRKGRLYRETHATFDAYCREKCRFTASRARQLANGAKTKEALETVTGVTIPNESVARAARRIPAHRRVQVIRAAEKASQAVGKSLSAPMIRATDRTYEEAERTGAVSIEGESNIIIRSVVEDWLETKTRQQQHIDERQNLMFACQIPARTDGEFIIARRPANVPADAEIVIRVMIPIESAREGEKAA